MTEEVRTERQSSAETSQAEARRERRRKGDGKAPWQPIVLPDDDEDEQPAAASSRRTPQLVPGGRMGLGGRVPYDPDIPAAFRRIAARLHAQQQRMWSARQAGGSGFAPAGAGPSSRMPSSTSPIDLTDDDGTNEASGSGSARVVKRRRLEPASSSLPPALRPGFVEPPPKPDPEVKFTCSICLENMKEEATTICGHIFCKRCILDSIKATKKCPTCRRKLGVKDVHRIYLQSSAL